VEKRSLRSMEVIKMIEKASCLLSRRLFCVGIG
jgi:hypothetical protein